MKRLLAVFELTVPEQRVVILLLSVLIAVAATRSYRAEKLTRAPVVTQPSPSPGILP
jgi:hypothetical protein